MQDRTDFPLDTKFKPDPHTVSKRFGNEIVLVHMQTNRIQVLNLTGARFWDLACSGMTLAEIRRQLFQEFEVEESRLAEEIDRMIRALQERKLLECYVNG